MDLQPIEARLEAAPEPEKWQVEEGWEGYRVFYKDDGPGDLPIAEEICQGTDSGEALAEFIAHAPEDIQALIDEVERLRDQVKELACLWDAVTDAVGVDTDSTRGEWQTAFDAKIESYHGHGYESGKRDGREENKLLSAQIDAIAAQIAEGADND